MTKQKPYMIDGVVGNSRMLVTLTDDGEMQRIFWPHVDGGQHVERLIGGVSIDGGSVRWLDDRAWARWQGYEQDQNVLVTQAVLSQPENVIVNMVDAAVPGRDLLVRQLSFTNLSDRPQHLRYVQYQWLRIDESAQYNTVLYDEVADSLLHFRREVFIALGADRPMADVSSGWHPHIWDGACHLQFGGSNVAPGDMAGAAVWDLGVLAPGAKAELTLFWAFGGNTSTVRELLAFARETGGEGLLRTTRQYWSDWLRWAKPLRVQESEEAPAYKPLALRLVHPDGDRRSSVAPVEYYPPDVASFTGLPEEPARPDELETLYKRSLLVFKLMSDERTGAVIAAPEFDPGYTQCGGYAYCWGRDAGYITVAMDLAGYHEMAAAFYRWAVRAQEPEGWWMHRHYASGGWGPSWGLIQVDETGSILYGMGVHARVYGGVDFVREVWPNVYKAAEWLIGNMDPESGLPMPSVDLWEERTAELTYSSGAVFAGLEAAAEMAAMLGEEEAAARYAAAAQTLREAILRECVGDGRFLRARWLKVHEHQYHEAVSQGRAVRKRLAPKGHWIYEVSEDWTPDSSLLGMAVPFHVV